MTDFSNPEVVATPGTAAGAKAFTITPFARLARAHAGGTVADAMVAAAFAGSLFFSLPADGARGPVLRYLVITMLPFAVLSPLIGPMIDRLKGGHRFVVIGAAVLRGLLAFLLIGQIEAAGTNFFLLALCLLVCQKAYQVGRSALVPSVVRSDRELVEANSKLSLISGLSSFAGAVPAAVLMQVFGPKWSLGLATLTYGVAAALAVQIPPSKVATTPPGEAEKQELRGAGIVMAGSAMGVLRWCVGFLTLLVAFGLRGQNGVTWQLAIVGGASVLSQLGGAAAAPKLRDHTKEENLLTGALVTVVVGSLLAVVFGDVLGAAVLGASVGFSAAVGKLAFDSILQRDAPDANRGRAFARFETRFQVMWVVGALIPVWVTMQIGIGFLVVGGMAAFALASYGIGRMAWAHRSGVRQTAATAAALGIEERFAGVSGEFKGQIGRVGRRALRRKPAADGEEPVDWDDDEIAYDEVATYADGDVYDDGDGAYGDDALAPDDGDAPAVEYGAPAWAGDPVASNGDLIEDPIEGSGYGPTRVVDAGPDGWEAPSAEPPGPTRVLTEPVADAVRADLPPPPGVGSPGPAWSRGGAADLDEGPDLGDDPDSWPEPEWADASPYPWDPPTEVREADGAFMADVPPTVEHPYPWTPDRTDPEGHPSR